MNVNYKVAGALRSPVTSL